MQLNAELSHERFEKPVRAVGAVRLEQTIAACFRMRAGREAIALRRGSARAARECVLATQERQCESYLSSPQSHDCS